MSHGGSHLSASKFLCVGPGGIDCPCCFPRRTKDRRVEFRRAKRRMDRVIARDIAEQLADDAWLQAQSDAGYDPDDTHQWYLDDEEDRRQEEEYERRMSDRWGYIEEFPSFDEYCGEDY